MNSFKDEYDCYKVMFEDQELISNKFLSKGVSEQELFFTVLDSIDKIDIKIDILEYECFQNAEENLKQIKIFNQPIKFDNKVLFWYRNIFIIYSILQKLKESKEKKRIEIFKLIQDYIHKIVSRNLFKKIIY